MKSALFTLVSVLAVIGQLGCSHYRDRLLFVEATHLGLIVKVSPDETSPADVNFGYRRSIVTLIPQVKVDVAKSNEDQAKDENGEVMSTMSSFTAKVRWFEATEIHTYFATGDAATNTAKSEGAIKALTKVSEK